MKQDTLKFVIQRFDNLYDACNTKSYFMMAYNIFICSSIIAYYTNTVDLINKNNNIVQCFEILSPILFALSLVSMVLILVAATPYLKSGNSSKKRYHSLIFFNSVSEFNIKEYNNEWTTIADDDILRDLVYQSHVLAKGLKHKYKFLRWSSYIIIVQMLIMIFSLIIWNL